MKKKLLEFIRKYPAFSKSIFSLCNWLNLKNKINHKGITLSVGSSLINGIRIKSTGVNNIVIIGDFVRVKNCTITIHGNNNRIIINDDSYLNQVELYMEDDNNEIVIGKYTNFCGRTNLATIEGTKIVIGENCLFSSELHFRTGDSHSILDLNGNRINVSKDITIGNHVWIGTKVTCLKGVNVSNDCIVAATTTLCREYNEPNCVIGGVPGKIIKRNVNWDKTRVKS